MLDRIVTVGEIQAKFPEPSRGDEFDKDGAYCVGGAFLAYFGIQPTEAGIKGGIRQWMPDAEELSDFFVQILGMDEEEAYEAAEDIIEANDSGNFEGAWRDLEEVLKVFATRHPELRKKVRKNRQLVLTP